MNEAGRSRARRCLRVARTRLPCAIGLSPAAAAELAPALADTPIACARVTPEEFAAVAADLEGMRIRSAPRRQLDRGAVRLVE